MESIIQSFAGASGSVIALSVFYPLDTIRTRLQVDEKLKAEGTFLSLKHILQNEGVSALYRGWLPVVSSLCVSNLIYFYCYSRLKKILDSQTVPSDLFCAFVAGCVNVIFTAPLWVINTRLRLQAAQLHTIEYAAEARARLERYRGAWHCALHVLKYEGVRAFWRGTLASLLLVSNPSLQFCVYELLRRQAVQRLAQGPYLPAIHYLVMGAIAKATATIMTYPLQVVQARVRAGFSEEEKRAATLFHVLKIIVKSQGFGGLYRGMESKLLQTALTAALMFLTYEKLVHLARRLFIH